MRRMTIFMTWLILLVDCLCGCITPTMLSEARSPKIIERPVETLPQKDEPALAHHEKMDITIPLTLKSGEAELNAEAFRPTKMVKPKTLVIMVPGSGNVSRYGESNSDGISTFKHSIEVNSLWAKELANRGFFVLSYDKRTCNSKINPICNDNWHKDIEEDGIKALASDLDQVCAFAKSKFEDSEGRIILFSSTQGAQVISLSNCLKQTFGVVLISPIIGDLDKMWINGLQHAAIHAKSEKNQLINRKESMESFFKSLKKGDFPDNANIKGASLKFWRSWIDASPKTLPKIMASKKPTLLLFSSRDSFSPPEFIKKVKNEVKDTRIKVSIIDGYDRNLADAEGPSEHGILETFKFIERLR